MIRVIHNILHCTMGKLKQNWLVKSVSQSCLGQQNGLGSLKSILQCYSSSLQKYRYIPSQKYRYIQGFSINFSTFCSRVPGDSKFSQDRSSGLWLAWVACGAELPGLDFSELVSSYQQMPKYALWMTVQLGAISILKCYCLELLSSLLLTCFWKWVSNSREEANSSFSPTLLTQIFRGPWRKPAPVFRAIENVNPWVLSCVGCLRMPCFLATQLFQ